MLRVLSLFSGIGAFEKALENLGVPFELIGYSEIDKYASKSYSAIHGVSEDMNLGDITKIDEKNLPKDIDLITYGFPCQDISLAGKQKGLFNNDGTQTRSGLFFDALRIIEETQPKIAIAENVKNLISKKFNAQFQVVLASLEAAGYNNYYTVSNSKDFGVPQNRERVIIVSIRKDIDTGEFEFPQPFPLTIRLKDILENDVEEKYYLSDAMVQYLTSTTDWAGSRNAKINKDIASPINTGEGRRRCDSSNYMCESLPDNADLKLLQIGQIYPNSGNPQAGRIYDAEGISPTMDTCSGGNRMPKVAVVAADDKQDQYIRQKESVFTETQAKMFTPDGNVKRYIDSEIIDNFDEGQIADISFPNGYNKGNRVFDCSPPLNDTTTKSSFCYKEKAPIRIRKLTPKECFRLMGFDDESFYKAKYLTQKEAEQFLAEHPKHKGKRQFTEEGRIERMSDTQIYKQAGNSIVVNVLEKLFMAIFATKIIPLEV